MGKRNKKGFKISLTIHLKKVDRVIVGILVCFIFEFTFFNRAPFTVIDSFNVIGIPLNKISISPYFISIP